MKARNNGKILGFNAQGCGPFTKSLQVCRHALVRFNRLRDRLVQKLVADVNELVPEGSVRQAIREAEALAWSTPFPALFLPVLAEEKVAHARQWASRQQQILERQRILGTKW